MSHEIRTPMNGVIGLIELLQGTELNAEQRTYAELIKQSGRNLVELISDILDLSKIEAHKIELENRDFDLQLETNGTINILSLKAQGKGLELISHIDPDVPLLLRGDAGRLRQVITNLLGNAVKFTEKGSILLNIGKEAEDDQLVTLRFQVRDSGIGIAADKQEQIFEPFTQADGSTTRTYGGTGLGLAISRQLVEVMGGTVGVESAEGKGATFWFTALFEKQSGPVVIPHDGINADDRAQPHLSQKPAGNNTHLLLVEDDRTNQLVIRSILAKHGYQVDVAGTGCEALKLLADYDYALVLMDCMMPEMNGYETTTAIRDVDSAVKNHTVPVIALTANAMREDRDNCLAAGMDDYLAKPLEVTELLMMLEKWAPTDFTCSTVQGAIGRNDAKAFDDLVNVFDAAEFIKRNLGDIELSCDVASIFIDSAPEYIELIRNALAMHDAEAIRNSAHKLKGVAANLALPLLVETALIIESSSKDGILDKVTELLPELEHRFEQAVETIQNSLISPHIKEMR